MKKQMSEAEFWQKADALFEKAAKKFTTPYSQALFCQRLERGLRTLDTKHERIELDGGCLLIKSDKWHKKRKR